MDGGGGGRRSTHTPLQNHNLHNYHHHHHHHHHQQPHHPIQQPFQHQHVQQNSQQPHFHHSHYAASSFPLHQAAAAAGVEPNLNFSQPPPPQQEPPVIIGGSPLVPHHPIPAAIAPGPPMVSPFVPPAMIAAAPAFPQPYGVPMVPPPIVGFPGAPFHPGFAAPPASVASGRYAPSLTARINHNPKVEAWMKETPLPTALAFNHLDDEDDEDHRSLDTVRRKGNSRNPYYSGADGADDDDDIVGSILLGKTGGGGGIRMSRISSRGSASASGKTRRRRDRRHRGDDDDDGDDVEDGGGTGADPAPVAPGRSAHRSAGPQVVYVGSKKKKDASGKGKKGRKSRKNRNRSGDHEDSGSSEAADPVPSSDESLAAAFGAAGADSDEDIAGLVPRGWVKPVGNEVDNLYYNPQRPIVPSQAMQEFGDDDRTRRLMSLLGDVATAAAVKRKAGAVSRKTVKMLKKEAEMEDAKAKEASTDDVESKEEGTGSMSPVENVNAVIVDAETEEAPSGKVGSDDSDDDRGNVSSWIRARALKQLEEKRLSEINGSSAQSPGRPIKGTPAPYIAKSETGKGGNRPATVPVLAPGRSRRDVFNEIMGDRDDDDEYDEDDESDGDEDENDEEEEGDEGEYEDDEDEADALPTVAEKMEILRRARVSFPPDLPDKEEDATSPEVAKAGDEVPKDPADMTQDQLYRYLQDLRIRTSRTHIDPVDALAASKPLLKSIRFLHSMPREQNTLVEVALKALKQIAAMGSAVVASAVGPDVGASGLSGSTAAEAAVSTIVAVDAASGKGISCVADAMHLMAGLYVRGVPGFRVGHRPDYGRAFTLYVSAARRDHPDAIFQVALCYELGSGVAPSAPRSVQYYRKAAALNHPGAMLRLGMAQLHGELGQKVAPRDALKWLRLSCKYADERYPQALYELALLHDVGVKNVIWQDYPYMIELLERGSDLGHALSQLKLGEAYEYGKFGCSVEPSKSVYYYSLAAANGNAEAMFELGGWYLTGAVDEAHDFELPASEVQARRWTALAAEGGYPRAMFALGFFLESGIGRTEGDQRDQEVAMLWYKRAAEAGDEKAIKRLEKEGVDTKEYRDEKARRKKAKKKDREAQKARRGRGGSSGTSRWMADSGLLVVDTVRAASGLRRRPDIPDELDGGNKCAVM